MIITAGCLGFGNFGEWIFQRDFQVYLSACLKFKIRFHFSPKQSYSVIWKVNTWWLASCALSVYSSWCQLVFRLGQKKLCRCCSILWCVFIFSVSVLIFSSITGSSIIVLLHVPFKAVWEVRTCLKKKRKQKKPLKWISKMI